MKFKEVELKEVQIDAFEKLSKEWMLITAGAVEDCGTLTASWGGFGYLWNKNVTTTYIRPQRNTKKYVDQCDTFTLTFFDESYRDALKFCGTVSGKANPNKIKESGLTAFEVDGTVAFEEANMIIVCRKLYGEALKPECFTDTKLEGSIYPEKDYHTMYVSEILKIYVAEN